MVINFDCWKHTIKRKSSTIISKSSSSPSKQLPSTTTTTPPLPPPRHHHHHRDYKSCRHNHHHHQHHRKLKLRPPSPECYCSCHHNFYHYHQYRQYRHRPYHISLSPPTISVRKFHHISGDYNYYPTTLSSSTSTPTLINEIINNNESSHHLYSSLNTQNNNKQVAAESVDSSSSSSSSSTKTLVEKLNVEQHLNEHLDLASSTIAAATLDTKIRNYFHNKQVKQTHHNQNEEQESYYSDIIIYDHQAIAAVGHNIFNGKTTKSSIDKQSKVIRLILIRLDLFKFAIMEPLKVDQRLIVFSLVDTFTKLSPNKILENYLKKLIAEQQHDGHHIAVFNLAEPLKFYQNINNSDKFLANVKLLEFGWPERRAPSLERLCSLCKSLDSWLTQNDQNSAIIYSKRDLSRASLAIAVFLQYIDICLGNDSNTTIFDFESMYNYFHYNLETYLQPSQKKYVNYFKSLLNGDSRINVQKLHLNQLIIHRVPNFDGCGRCRPFIKIYQGWQLRYSSPVIDIDNEFLKCWNYIVFDIQPPLKLRGEILIKCYHKSAVPSSKTEMFAFQFHTGTLTTTTVTLDKSDLDCALYDRRLPDDIQVELVFNNDRSNQILDSGQSSYQIDDDSQIIRCNSYENFFNTQTTAAMTQKSSVGTATVEDKCVPSLEYTKGPLDGSLYATVLKKPTSIEPATNQQQLLPEQPQQAKIKDEFVLDELINEIFTEIQSFPDVRTNLETKPIPLRTQSSSSKESYYDFVTKNGQEYSSEIPGGDMGKENIDPIVSEQQQNLDWLQRQQQKLLTIRRNRPKQTVEQQLIAELKTSIKQSPSSMVHRSTPPEVPTRTSSRNIFLSQIPYQDDTDNDDYGIIHKIQNGANNQSINEQTVMKIDEVERDKNVNQYIDSLAELPTSSAQFLAGLKLTDSDSQQLRSSTPAFPVRQKNRKLSSLLKQTMNDGQHNVPMFIQDTSSYWYKPTISREEAVRYLQDRPPGSFIIRDSNSFPNAFGLAVRVAREDARPDSIDPVRHFLIESTNKGVQIKGCLEEPVFSSLAALVYQHSITKISLPIRLTIPSSNDDLDISNYGSLYSDTNLLKQFYENGAACNVLYFIKEDVESLTGNAAIKKVIDQMIMNSSDRKKIQPAIIHFKASSKGITLTDNSHRLFFRQHYPIKSISFCSIDPDNRCWPYHSDHALQLESYLFGFVTQKKNTPLENECLIFGHYEPDQPPHAIVDFVNKLKNVS